MRKNVFFKMKLLLLALFAGAIVTNAQTGNVVWEIFQPTVKADNETALKELRYYGDTEATASKLIVQLNFGEGSRPENYVGLNGWGQGIDGYNSRVKGYLFVQEEATYKFLMGSDDGALFCMNPNGASMDEADMEVIVRNQGYTGDWNNSAVKDAGRTLTPGVYAFIITHSEGSGGDYVQIGVQVDGAAAVTVGLPESKIVLSQTAEALVAPSLVSVPANIQQGQTAIFYGIKLDVTQADMTIAGATIPVTTTIPGSDIQEYALYLNTSAPSLVGATKLAGTATLSGGNVVATGLTDAVIPAGTTGYLLLAVQLKDAAALNNTINGGAIADLSAAITATGAPAIYSATSLAAGSSMKVVQKTDAQSTIAAATFTYPTNIDYKPAVNSYLNIGKFTLADVGLDGKSTIVNSLTVELGEWQNIAGLAVYDGTTLLTESAVGGAVTTLSGFSLTANSASTKDFFLAVKFKSIVIDRAVISAKIVEAVADAVNSQVSATGLNAAATTQTGDGNKIQVTATTMAFLTQPASSGIYGVTLAAQPVVQSIDVNGSVDTDVNDKDVTLANNADAVMANNTATLVNGTATFSGFAINHPSAVTITANADGLAESVPSIEIVLVSNLYSVEDEWPQINRIPAGQGTVNVTMGRIIYESKATADEPIIITGFIIGVGDSSDPGNDIKSVKVNNNGVIYETDVLEDGQYVITVPGEGIIVNSTGNKVYSMQIDVADNATINNIVDVQLEAIVIGETIILPSRQTNEKSTRRVTVPMSGDYYIDLDATEDLFADGGRNFTSFADVVKELRERGAVAPGVNVIIQDDQVFELQGDGGRNSITISGLANPAAPVVFKRSGDGAERPKLMIKVTSDYFGKMLVIRNCAYMTFDGLHFESQWEGTKPPENEMGGIVLGADEIVPEEINFLNCKIVVHAKWYDRNSGYGIRYMNSNEGYASHNGRSLTNSKFINNEFEDCVTGLYFEMLKNVEISGNTFTDFSSTGIYANNLTNVQIKDNVISNVEKTTHTGNTADRFGGIWATGMIENVTVSGNMIYNLKTTIADGNANVIGIQASTLNNTIVATTNNIFNNMIWDIDAPNTTRNGQVVRGIVAGGSGVLGIYNNSVYLTANSTSNKNVSTFTSIDNTKVTLKNNIFINKSTSTSAISVLDIASANLLEGSNNNIYFVENAGGGAANINQNGPRVTIEDYQMQVQGVGAIGDVTPGGKEGLSSSADVAFMLGDKALNVAAASQSAVIGKGVDISEVETDIWGITRNNPSTIGAWEKPAFRTVTITDGTIEGAASPVEEGTTITIKANMPATGKEFIKWTSADTDFAEVTSSTTTLVVKGKNITAAANYDWINYKITITGGGTADKATANMNQEVTLTPVPLPGWEFVDWTVTAGGVTIANNKFTMGTADVAITGNYKKIVYTITITDGTASAATGTVGDVITLTPTPATGYELDAWVVEEGGATVSGNDLTVATANVKVKGTYKLIDYTITVTDGTSDKSTANMGNEVTLTAGAPAAGYEFDAWEVEEGGVTVTDNKFTVVTANVKVKATYKKIIYTIAVTGGTADKATASIGDEVTLTLTATPDAGYEFNAWEVEEGGVTVADNKFTVATANVKVKATFKKIVYTITVTGGTADKATAVIGDEVTLTATGHVSGGAFMSWTVKEGGVTVTDNKFTVGSANVAIEAVYNIGTDGGELSAIAVYPSPAVNYISVSGINADSAYSIVNTNGQIVVAGTYNGNEVDVTSLTAGTYFFISGEKSIAFIKK